MLLVLRNQNVLLLAYRQTATISLQWRHNECNGVSNHQPDDCLVDRLFRCRSKKTSKLRVTGLCAGHSFVKTTTYRHNYKSINVWMLTMISLLLLFSQCPYLLQWSLQFRESSRRHGFFCTGNCWRRPRNLFTGSLKYRPVQATHSNSFLNKDFLWDTDKNWRDESAVSHTTWILVVFSKHRTRYITTFAWIQCLCFTRKYE